MYEFRTLIAVHEWEWDGTSSDSLLILDGREVLFHPCYSLGTAAVRGNRPCVGGNDYYWEIKVLTPLCGTNVVSDVIWWLIHIGSKRALRYR
jgi:SPRY domain-containing SOCS box protein 3